MLQNKLKGKHIIYIGRELNSIDGGSIVSKRNVEILKKMSDEKIIEFYLSDKTIAHKFLNIIFGNPWGYSREVYNKIKKALLLNEISYIFIDHSLLGGFSSILKKFNIEIVVFFHNIEVKYYKDKASVDGFINKLMVNYARRNEKKIVKYADKIICLTNIDSNLLKSIYGRSADLIIPITIEDKFKSLDNLENSSYHLFVGSSFFANIDAIKWYIKNVLPFISSKLIIIGTGMEVLIEQYGQNLNLEIHGFVDDLTPFYQGADFVINPVRLGSGMKTKTIEALMYGKIILGTQEAFSGIEDIEKHEAGYICNQPEEFIKKIENLDNKKFNLKSRDYYLSNFSAEFGYNKLEDFLAS
ncbi:glycosyltransferase [uncultured Flavobacterium sp.]|uniref:glycosyltransferase n=2 Tax=uncultured Flavobacterium sp. TaxID=165435 RepID=UPI0025FB90FD|nr:glycosyltransferase [uncultured Flavobacterium sp.]